MYRKVILISLFVISLITHLVLINKTPPAMTGDELAIAYNGYSLWHYGYDEHGARFPLSFKSFGDYKLPLAMYLLAPIVGTWGINVWTVKLPIAILSSFTAIVLALLVEELYKGKEKSKAAFWCGLALALSPWYIHFSRGAWEASLGVLFSLLGGYWLIIGKRKSIYLFFAAIVWSLAMYTYHSPRVTVPILAVGIFIFEYINIFSSGKLKVQFNDSFNWKNFIGPVILGLILLFPVAKQMIGVQGQARIIGSSITYYWGEPTYLLKLHDNVIRAHELDTEMFFRPYMFLNDGFTKFLAYISPAQLAEFGDAVDRHHVPNMGRILVVELVFAIIGLAFAMKHKNYLMKYIGLFVIAGMLPASVTRDEFHSIRSLFMAVPIAMFVGVGISAIEKYRKTLILLLLIWFGSFGFYFVIYQITVPRERSIGYQYGMQAATKYIKEHYDEYDQVIIDPPEIYGNPYIHVLSYLNYDSSKYQATVSRGDNYERNPPIAEVYGFDKFLFRPIYLPEDRNLKRTLLVGTVENLPMDQIKEIPNGKLQEEIKDPGGKTLIRLFAVQ